MIHCFGSSLNVQKRIQTAEQQVSPGDCLSSWKQGAPSAFFILLSQRERKKTPQGLVFFFSTNRNTARVPASEHLVHMDGGRLTHRQEVGWTGHAHFMSDDCVPIKQ